MSARVVVVERGRLGRGASYCYRSSDAALRASHRVTSSPAVVSLTLPGGETRYLAAGDCWLGRDGERGQYLSGRRGELVDLVEREIPYAAAP